MAIPIRFIKCSGAGNDFVLIDNMDGSVAIGGAELAVALCSRPFGVGADGLLIMEKSHRADFAMKYYNADGSYGGMCGNGGRCIAMFAFRAGYAGPSMRFDALDTVYSAEIAGSTVRLRMKDPSGFRTGLRFPLDRGEVEAAFLDTGSPHLVLFTADLEQVDVLGLGKTLRFRPELAPEGANVNFVRREGPSEIAVRTYERGVELETLACGTGSVAAAVVSSLLGHCVAPVTVRVRSGESLLVRFEKKDDRVTDVVLEGSAHMLFSGNALYDPLSHSLESLQTLT
jgi:diaminopimelate epimerase